MRIARFLEKTRAEGPGERAAIWLQGCPHHCRGCFARDTWDPDCGIEMDIDAIYKRIQDVSDEIEGITVLGGEPLYQAKELSALLTKIKKLDLGVTVFTGYVYEYVRDNGTEDQKKVLEMTDLLIDGPYMEEKRDFSRPLVGSSNQRFLFLSDRYSREDIERLKNRVEVRISGDGIIRINGMDDFPLLEKTLVGFGMNRR